MRKNIFFYMLTTLKHIFFDILRLYKHFLNWNIHKVLAHITGLAYALLLIVFFAIIYFVIAKVGGFSEVNLFSLLTGSLGENMFAIGYQYIVLLIFGMTFFFAHMLLGNMYFSYIKKEKLPYLQNRYFDVQLLKQYMLLTSGLLLVAGAFFWMYLVIIRTIYQGSLQAISLAGDQNIYFASVTLGILVLFVLVFLYFVYRFGFAFIYILRKKTNIKTALKTSWGATKGSKKLIQTIVAMLVFSAIVFPFRGMETSLEKTQQTVQDYILLSYNASVSKNITELEQARLEQYKIQFQNYQIGELSSINASLELFRKIFTVIYFFLITGYITMLYVSIFSRIIEPNTKKLG